MPLLADSSVDGYGVADGWLRAGVADMEAFMRELAEGGMDYMLSTDRQREAEKVAPCAARWVEGEMDLHRQLTAARGPSIGPLGAPPSLAEKLGAKLERASTDTTAAAAVHKALAVGYLSYCETEGVERSRSRLTARPQTSGSSGSATAARRWGTGELVAQAVEESRRESRRGGGDGAG